MRVTEVHFNHDTNHHTADALNIREDETAGSRIVAPEWRDGQPAKPAAYAAEALSNNITIKARFADGPPDQTVKIRAVDTQLSPGGPSGCIGWLARILIALARALSGNVLGEPQARLVSFDANGVSNVTEFKLKGHTVKQRPVGINTTSWRWEAYVDGKWADIGTTQHKIYVILDTPFAPWQQQPYTNGNLQLPWARALEYACNWALLARNTLEATDNITYRINRHPLQSYTPMTMFGWTTYQLSDYLDSLEAGSPFQMNCTDCADATTTLANLLGCKQAEGRFFNMQTRKFLTLGGDPSNPGDWVDWSWSYHELSWVEQIGANERLFDACLQVDMDDNDNDYIHVARLPRNMLFGNTGSDHYRRRLVASGPATLATSVSHRPVG